MMQEFSFAWNGRNWNGYFNALARKTVIAHFEEAHIRETVGQTIAFSKSESGAISHKSTTGTSDNTTEIFDAIVKGVETKLGEPLLRYLN